MVVVLLFIFGSLFRIESVEANHNVSQDEALFTVMPHSETNSYLLEQEARDELDDPTIMSLPHQKLGFSQVLVNEGEPPQPNLPTYKVSARSISGLERPRTPLVGIYKEPDATDGNSFVKPSLPPVELMAKAKTFTQRIVWLEDGKEKLCPLRIEACSGSSKGKVPVKNTRILLQKLSKSYVCFLVGKCGVAELDTLVLEYIQNKKEAVVYRGFDIQGFTKEIEVDWRLVLTSTKSPK